MAHPRSAKSDGSRNNATCSRPGPLGWPTLDSVTTQTNALPNKAFWHPPELSGALQNSLELRGALRSSMELSGIPLR
eukprot:11034886-Alexandrium_andersonii.AAC.1